MKGFNVDKFDKTKIPVFILTYLGIKHFKNWSEEVRKDDRIQFVIVDNGNQTVDGLDIPIFQTSKNVGCAGGWNVISHIAFKYYNLTKIVIGQDDAVFNYEMVSQIYSQSDENTLVGAYNRSFEFSLFGLDKNFWTTVGMFDENFIYVNCEDNDYKHRAKLFNKRVLSLNYSADMNASLTSRHIMSVVKPVSVYNSEYIKAKWGQNYEYSSPFNDDRYKPSECTIHSGLRDVYGQIDKFPSLYETETL